MSGYTNGSFKVYIIKGPDYNGSGTPPIETMFTDPIFDTTKIVIDEPPSKARFYNTPGDEVDTCIGKNCGKLGCKECNGTHFMVPITPDYEIFSAVYNHWITNNPTLNIVIVKSSTVSSLSPSTLKTYLDDSKILTTSEPYDTFYFAKWLDRAEQFMTLKTYTGGAKLVRTWNPHGFQAIAYTKIGFEKLVSSYKPNENPVVCRPFSQVLNTLIQKGTLKALTVTPSPMQYDSTLVNISSLSNSALLNSYLRSSEIRGNELPETPKNNRFSSSLSLFWFVAVTIVAIVSVIIVFGLGIITPKKQKH